MSSVEIENHGGQPMVLSENLYKFGSFSWVYGGFAYSEPVIAVQWLRYQGKEFYIKFKRSSTRDAALKMLFDMFCPDRKPNKVDRYTVQERYDYSFDVELTISPLALFDLLAETYPDEELQLVLTPTTFESRQFFYGDNCQLIQNQHETKMRNGKGWLTSSYLIVNAMNRPLLAMRLGS